MRRSYLFHHGLPGASPLVSGANEYGKPGVDQDAGPTPQLVPPQLRAAYTDAGGTRLLLDLAFDPQLNAMYGAPQGAWVSITAAPPTPTPGQEQAEEHRNTTTAATATSTTTGLQIELTLVGKRPTRLPEATWFTFGPPPGTASGGFRLNKLGAADGLGWADPTQVVDGAAKSLHGISPDMPSLRAFRAGGGQQQQQQQPDGSANRSLAISEDQVVLEISSLDAGVVRFDAPFPTPTPIFRQPNVSLGASFALHMNTWNTNYPFWFPYEDQGAADNLRFRFRLDFAAA
eukprot:SAG22_NODE_519_length_9510_cov_6.192222_6_plen_288_part_00